MPLINIHRDELCHHQRPSREVLVNFLTRAYKLPPLIKHDPVIIKCRLQTTRSNTTRNTRRLGVMNVISTSSVGNKAPTFGSDGVTSFCAIK